MWVKGDANVNKIHIKTEKLGVWNCLEINYISLRPGEVKGVGGKV